uniref:Ig-like domain-containing protein n=1 Tax=Verminephrobacter aporrectodeae TaxID=1110389 RepID=UPI00023750CE
MTDLTDNAGVGQAVSTVTYDIDVLPPRCTIRLADSTLSAGDTTTVSFSFNEPVTGLDARDIDLSNANGTLGPLTALADGRTWSAPFTPSANINDASNTIRLAMRGVADLAGNPAQNGTAVSSNYRIDTRPGTADQAPDLSATVTLTDEHLTAGETATVIMAFNQPVPGLTINDIDLTQANGTLSEPALSADGRTWTATFTPTANVNDASNTIRVNLAGLTGSATSANFSVHTAPSAATITLADTVLTTGHTTTVTFTFTQTVLGFTVDDIDLTQANGTLGPLTTVNNKTWTATFTPKAAVNDAANHISVNLAGVSTVDGRSGTGSVSSDNYAVNTQLPDTTRPALSTATVNGDQLVLTYTEENTLSDAALTDNAGFTVTNAAGTTIAVTNAVVNAAAKTITLTLGHAVAHGEDVAISYTQPEGAGGVADAAGNSAANFPDMRVTNTTPAPADTTPPQLITSGETTRPRVNGDQLVLSFDDSSDLDADPDHKPESGAFAV